MNKFDKLCDEIDASVFSGDILTDKLAREEFKYFLKRWSKEVIKWEDIESRKAGENNVQ